MQRDVKNEEKSRGCTENTIISAQLRFNYKLWPDLPLTPPRCYLGWSLSPLRPVSPATQVAGRYCILHFPVLYF